MKTTGCSLGLLILAGMLVGCQQQTPGKTRQLGTVSYESAFAAARDVVSQYYPVSREDPATGIIECLPKSVEAPPERLLGGSPARHVTTVRVRREGEAVSAQVAVAVQRQGRFIRRQMRTPAENYDGPPHGTPGQYEAATTPEQNDVWMTEGYAHNIEIRILDDLYKSLHPEAVQK
ncbi:MAG TPA: hypothetical protein VMZ50_02590 [Phycisphaerae bacterium]|nr:hypothetical protein [Phycisphaerae bacterium]